MEQIILDGSQRGLENGKWRTYTDIMPSITAREYKEPRSVMEVIQIGNIAEEKNFRNPQTGRIYDVRGCSPTLSTMQGGNQEPKILEEKEQRLEVNMQGTSNCLTSVQKDNLVMESQVLTPKRTEYGKQIRKAYESGQIQESRHNMTELEPRKDDISNTLTTVQKDNLVLENPLLLGGVGKENEFGSQYRQGNRVYSSNACAMALNSQPVGNAGGNSYLYNVGYRIRKLTPRECGRLMGVSDEDIDKMAAVNSNTQLYKQFGNSIVVDVMCAMFKNLNINQ